MSQKIERIKALVELLNEAAKAFYQEDKEIMSNLAYDRLYDELLALEASEGIVLSGSPTKKVGYEILSDLPKEPHEQSMLSLDKTKSVEDLAGFLGSNKGVLSWKLDGLTIVLTYENGTLIKAVTRGNGEVGEVITNNARVFDNVPLNIVFKGKLIVRGEAIILYSDFEAINRELSGDEQYKNPRNLCSGTVRQLNNEITAARHVKFMAFQIVEMSGQDASVFEYKHQQLEQLKQLGFDVVAYQIVNGEKIPEAISQFQEKIADNDFGSDGLVLTFDDIAYSQSLGRTSKFPKDAIAFKWQDEIAETTLIDIEWSASRTGLINPVAIFEPVELEGTTVARASLHNLSIIEQLELGIGDEIGVYKANMIIPQLAYNNTKSNHLIVPEVCPVCDEKTTIEQVRDVKNLTCPNPDCPAKQIKSLAHYVSRNCMNIEGLSEASLEKLVQSGLVKNFVDIYHLEQHKEAIINMDGFGEKSYQKMIASIEASKTVNSANFINALGINNVGLSNAKLLVKVFDGDIRRMMAASADDFVAIKSIGDVIAESLEQYFDDPFNRQQVEALLSILTMVTSDTTASKLSNKTFVITGSLVHYENRNALTAVIEQFGGKVTSSVTNNTDYLINNDVNSGSSKNKKAKSLNIPIINEEAFIAMIS